MERRIQVLGAITPAEQNQLINSLRQQQSAYHIEIAPGYMPRTAPELTTYANVWRSLAEGARTDRELTLAFPNHIHLELNQFVDGSADSGTIIALGISRFPPVEDATRFLEAFMPTGGSFSARGQVAPGMGKALENWYIDRITTAYNDARDIYNHLYRMSQSRGLNKGDFEYLRQADALLERALAPLDARVARWRWLSQYYNSPTGNDELRKALERIDQWRQVPVETIESVRSLESLPDPVLHFLRGSALEDGDRAYFVRHFAEHDEDGERGDSTLPQGGVFSAITVQKLKILPVPVGEAARRTSAPLFEQSTDMILASGALPALPVAPKNPARASSVIDGDADDGDDATVANPAGTGLNEKTIVTADGAGDATPAAVAKLQRTLSRPPVVGGARTPVDPTFAPGRGNGSQGGGGLHDVELAEDEPISPSELTAGDVLGERTHALTGRPERSTVPLLDPAELRRAPSSPSAASRVTEIDRAAGNGVARRTPDAGGIVTAPDASLPVGARNAEYADLLNIDARSEPLRTIEVDTRQPLPTPFGEGVLHMIAGGAAGMIEKIMSPDGHFYSGASSVGSKQIPDPVSMKITNDDAIIAGWYPLSTGMTLMFGVMSDGETSPGAGWLSATSALQGSYAAVREASSRGALIPIEDLIEGAWTAREFQRQNLRTMLMTRYGTERVPEQISGGSLHAWTLVGDLLTVMDSWDSPLTAAHSNGDGSFTTFAYTAGGRIARGGMHDQIHLSFLRVRRGDIITEGSDGAYEAALGPDIGRFSPFLAQHVAPFNTRGAPDVGLFVPWDSMLAGLNRGALLEVAGLRLHQALEGNIATPGASQTVGSWRNIRLTSQPGHDNLTIGALAINSDELVPLPDGIHTTRRHYPVEQHQLMAVRGSEEIWKLRKAEGEY